MAREVNTPKSKKILTCKEDIKTYMGNISDYMFRKYISLGMPCRYEGRDWIAHADNIERWYMAYTGISMRKSLKELPEDAL